MNERKKEWKNEWKEGWMKEWMNERKEGWKEWWMNERKKERMNKCLTAPRLKNNNRLLGEWMNECLKTPQHEKQIGYWVSEKGKCMKWLYN